MIYLTSQHVRSHLDSRVEDVHAFIHRRADQAPLDPIDLIRQIEMNAGELIAKDVPLVKQGGNEVLSYLDVLVAEDLPARDLLGTLAMIQDMELDPSLLPVLGKVGQAIFRISIRPDLQVRWKSELDDLVQSLSYLARKAIRESKICV